MTEASSGYCSSHSSAPSRDAPHLTPTDVPEPRNAKILAPTLTTTSPSQGSSCQAPGLARQYASNSSHVTSAILSTSRGSACKPRPVRPIVSYISERQKAPNSHD